MIVLNTVLMCRRISWLLTQILNFRFAVVNSIATQVIEALSVVFYSASECAHTEPVSIPWFTHPRQKRYFLLDQPPARGGRPPGGPWAAPPTRWWYAPSPSATATASSSSAPRVSAPSLSPQPAPAAATAIATWFLSQRLPVQFFIVSCHPTHSPRSNVHF